MCRRDLPQYPFASFLNLSYEPSDTSQSILGLAFNHVKRMQVPLFSSRISFALEMP